MKLTAVKSAAAASILLASLAAGAAVYTTSTSSSPPLAEKQSGGIARVAAVAASRHATVDVGSVPEVDLSSKGLPAEREAARRRAPRNALAATDAPKPEHRPRKVEPPPAPAPLPAPAPAPAVDSDAIGNPGWSTTVSEAAERAPAAVAPAPATRRLAPIARERADDDAGWRPSTPVMIASSVGAIGLGMAALGAGFGDGPTRAGFAVTGGGIGAIGLATAGILLLIEPDEDEAKPVQVGVGPAAVSMRGAF